MAHCDCFETPLIKDFVPNLAPKISQCSIVGVPSFQSLGSVSVLWWFQLIESTLVKFQLPRILNIAFR